MVLVAHVIERKEENTPTRTTRAPATASFINEILKKPEITVIVIHFTIDHFTRPTFQPSLKFVKKIANSREGAKTIASAILDN